jgi:predicted CopG family antitoxin
VWVVTRHRYIRKPTTILVDRDVAEQLRKLRLNRGEPLGEVVRRLVEEYTRCRTREVYGY